MNLFQKSRVDRLQIDHKFHTTVDVLRLDLVHPVVSGNKIFKLKYYLEEATLQKKKTIITFGGAYSNHIIASAAACSMQGMRSVGIIRGEEPKKLSHTLAAARENGMELFFLGRKDYLNKILPQEILEKYEKDEIYIIPEGGFGPNGMKGAQDILAETKTSSYTHIIAACGTGTMLAGLINAAAPGQHIIGVSVLKNNFSVEDDIRSLLQNPSSQFKLNFDYSFGGYAKSNQQLFIFMNEFYRKHRIPSDFVYTGKLFFALEELLNNDYFPNHARILAIHSGGLQGNFSLEKGKLIF